MSNAPAWQVDDLTPDEVLWELTRETLIEHFEMAQGNLTLLLAQLRSRLGSGEERVHLLNQFMNHANTAILALNDYEKPAPDPDEILAAMPAAGHA